MNEAPSLAEKRFLDDLLRRLNLGGQFSKRDCYRVLTLCHRHYAREKQAAQREKRLREIAQEFFDNQHRWQELYPFVCRAMWIRLEKALAETKEGG